MADLIIAGAASLLLFAVHRCAAAASQCRPDPFYSGGVDMWDRPARDERRRP